MRGRETLSRIGRASRLSFHHPPDGSTGASSLRGSNHLLLSLSVPGLEESAAERAVELQRETGALGVREGGAELDRLYRPPIGVHEGRRRGVTRQSSLLENGQITLCRSRSRAAPRQPEQVADPYPQDRFLRPPHLQQGPEQALLSGQKGLDAEGFAQLSQVVRRQLGERFDKGLAAVHPAVDLQAEEVILE